MASDVQALPRMGRELEGHRVLLIVNTKHCINGFEWPYGTSVKTCQVCGGERFRTAVKMKAVGAILLWYEADEGHCRLSIILTQFRTGQHRYAGRGASLGSDHRSSCVSMYAESRAIFCKATTRNAPRLL
jgi:hypothetical protein